MEKQKLKEISAQFAEARKEIMQLRLENRKLESALTMLSKPMVLSDDEAEQSSHRRSDSAEGAIVIALPQGEAQDRIDQLLVENAKLATEISDLQQQSDNVNPMSSMYEKNKESEKRCAELEAELVSKLKSHQAKYDRDTKKLRSDLLYEHILMASQYL